MAMTLLALVPLLVLQTGGKLQINDTSVGKGDAVRVGDRVTVDYTGKLTNGKKFDSSVGREPFSFIVGAGEVIKGWDQGLQGMKVGGKRKLTIPSHLAYGERGAGADIPPNATLVFDIELKKVERVQSTILKKGKGTPVTGGDTVQLHYKGTLQGGKQFDSSYDRNQPFDVQVGRTGLIPGFTMALIGMLPGEKKRVTIPPSLGYGEKGAGGVIPGNATLVFEIEVLKVTK